MEAITTFLRQYPAAPVPVGLLMTAGGLRFILSGSPKDRSTAANITVKTFAFLAVMAGERLATQPLATLIEMPKMHPGLQAALGSTLAVTGLGLYRYERGTDRIWGQKKTDNGERRQSTWTWQGIPFAAMFLAGVYLVKLPLAAELAEKLSGIGARRLALVGIGGAAAAWTGLRLSSRNSVMTTHYWGKSGNATPNRWESIATTLPAAFAFFGLFLVGRELVGISAGRVWEAIKASDRFKNMFTVSGGAAVTTVKVVSATSA